MKNRITIYRWIIIFLATMEMMINRQCDFAFLAIIAPCAICYLEGREDEEQNIKRELEKASRDLNVKLTYE